MESSYDYLLAIPPQSVPLLVGGSDMLCTNSHWTTLYAGEIDSWQQKKHTHVSARLQILALSCLEAAGFGVEASDVWYLST